MTCSVFLWIALSTGLGYLSGRLRPVRRLLRWNDRRVFLGAGPGRRKVTEADAYLYLLLHPVCAARMPKWSPFHRPPPPPPEPISLDETFFKGSAPGEKS